MRTEDRLRRLDRLDAPDLWPEIRNRRPSGDVPGSRWSRATTVAMALAVAAAGVGLAAIAFLGDPRPRPVSPASPTATPTPTRPAIPTPSPDPEFEANHSDPWAAPTALSITCTRDGIEVLAGEVPAQPDGVHVVVENPGGGRYLASRVIGPRPVPFWDRTDVMTLRKEGLTRELHLWSPGPVEIFCKGHGVHERKETVQITDPHGLWISDELPCEETVPYERRKVILHQDLATVVRESVRGVLPTDEIVRAGYPEDSSPVASMVVLRDGVPVATIILIYVGSEEGGWLPNPGEICVGSGIMGA